MSFTADVGDSGYADLIKCPICDKYYRKGDTHSHYRLEPSEHKIEKNEIGEVINKLNTIVKLLTDIDNKLDNIEYNTKMLRY